MKSYLDSDLYSDQKYWMFYFIPLCISLCEPTTLVFNSLFLKWWESNISFLGLSQGINDFCLTVYFYA